MPELPKILTRHHVCESRLFAVESADIEFSNGERREYEYLRSRGGGAVIIVPVVSEHEVLLVREYGIGVEGYEWGLPKGKVDLGESFDEAANRELKEEAGYGANKLTILKGLTINPNYMQHKTHLVVAESLYPESLPGDEPEPLEVGVFSLNDLSELSMRGDITEARTIASLYMVRDWLAQK